MVILLHHFFLKKKLIYLGIPQLHISISEPNLLKKKYESGYMELCLLDKPNPIILKVHAQITPIIPAFGLKISVTDVS